jgi:hypothetical protein
MFITLANIPGSFSLHLYECPTFSAQYRLLFQVQCTPLELAALHALELVAALHAPPAALQQYVSVAHV